MNSNGNTIDREGRLITCEHTGRRVTRTELDGSITIIADKFKAKKLNSPNDAVVAADGSIWFCDPAYGIGGFYEGIKADAEQDKKNVYRVDPKSGAQPSDAIFAASPSNSPRRMSSRFLRAGFVEASS
jgi:gluconolactonase